MEDLYYGKCRIQRCWMYMYTGTKRQHNKSILKIIRNKQETWLRPVYTIQHATMRVISGQENKKNCITPNVKLFLHYVSCESLDFTAATLPAY